MHGEGSVAEKVHRVVILGGGFGGLSAAQALKRAPAQVTLIDRRNFHLFQPLLYQVATGSLSPGEIAAPLRSVLRKQKNTEVLLGEAADIIAKHPIALQLRNLQTLTEISSEKNSTVIFPAQFMSTIEDVKNFIASEKK